MAGNSSNRARRRKRDISHPVDIDELLEPMRAEITRLNRESREYLAEKSRAKKKKMSRVPKDTEKRESTLRSHGASGCAVPT